MNCASCRAGDASLDRRRPVGSRSDIMGRDEAWACRVPAANFEVRSGEVDNDWPVVEPLSERPAVLDRHLLRPALAADPCQEVHDRLLRRAIAPARQPAHNATRRLIDRGHEQHRTSTTVGARHPDRVIKPRTDESTSAAPSARHRAGDSRPAESSPSCLQRATRRVSDRVQRASPSSGVGYPLGTDD